MCGEPEREEVKEAETTKYYKLTAKGREQIITRRTVKDPATKRAQKVIYQVINPGDRI